MQFTCNNPGTSSHNLIHVLLPHGFAVYLLLISKDPDVWLGSFQNLLDGVHYVLVIIAVGEVDVKLDIDRLKFTIIYKA